MKSVFERAIGPGFDSLHPAIQERFSVTCEDERRCVGRGKMATIAHNPLAVPALWWLARGNLLFPETGTDVPFEVGTYPFQDRDGTETVAYIRRYETDPVRRFDAYMTYDEDRACVVDYLGRVFRYDGWFTVGYEDCPTLQPEDAPAGWTRHPTGQPEGRT